MRGKGELDSNAWTKSRSLVYQPKAHICVSVSLSFKESFEIKLLLLLLFSGIHCGSRLEDD